MELAAFVQHLRDLPDYAGQIAYETLVPPQIARYQALERPLSPAVRQALEQRGVSRLYTHQSQAIDAARQGEHVIVATGTASGKTLGYTVPTLEAILEDPLSRALYIFPTKALAQDQLRSLNELTVMPGLERISAATYDGDTPQSVRPRLRRYGQILLTNPDMLHVGILPNHSQWAAFLRHLRYIVLDEAHVYRGVFGSHVALVMRRLARLCRQYGGNPQFILCSATVANPGEHAQRLVGQTVTVVDEDGAPRGPRYLLLWNPPYADPSAGVRHSINTQATLLFTELVRHGLRNITFVRARKIAELILLYAQDALRSKYPELLERISAYRGGYLPEERRAIEHKLFAGEMLGVTATNALELGIDVGALDATLMVGYPGTIASFWQQAGRAGRGHRAALSVMLGYDNPLDQYFMRHPDELLGRPHEHALMDPGNPHIRRGHLLAAAYERPLDRDDVAVWGDGSVVSQLAYLEQEGELQRRHDRWYYVGEDYPAQRVNLRSTSSTDYWLVDVDQNGEMIERIDAETAFLRVYPGAIYLHQARAYRVVDLDLDARIAYARQVDADYYTQPIELNDVRIIRSLDVREVAGTHVFLGEVRVSQQILGMRRKAQFTEAVLGEEAFDLPETRFGTQALWWAPDDAMRRTLEDQGLDWGGALHAVEHACIAMMPLLAMCDRNDIGGLSTPQHPDTGEAQVFVYDGYPGGVGLVAKGFELIGELWQRTCELVTECPCEAGCPSCVYSPKCGNNNEPIDKEGARVLLKLLLGQG